MPDKRIISVKQLRTAILELINKSDFFNESLSSELPNAWEKYGDLVLFQSHCFFSPFWANFGDNLWEMICALLNCRRIGIKGHITSDDFRSPKVSLIYGQAGVVKFIDNSIKYSWDLEKSMFCRGNLSERHRIAKLDCKTEVIVDLFAGIGYFTLPYLVKAKADFVHACDWNPHAIKALRRNLELNRVSEKCAIHVGDNRKFAPKNVGNRVNVGLIPDSEGFWQTACEVLISSGGVIYIHQNVTSGILKIDHCKLSYSCPLCRTLLNDYKLSFCNCCVAIGTSSFVEILEGVNINWKRVEWFEFSLHLSHSLLGYLENFHGGKWKVTVKEYFKIKSYAPHIDHLVFGVYCYPM